ncbi:unnamed protein product [Cladocopium goreaui]|uniref:Uncharacterized protein n=1 Tax=Cladocopium goreaui TaxID=2562237 RepID=A0A9P1D7J3_9DINO|nr:unnamed protein product [Cladocopium goreaui]
MMYLFICLLSSFLSIAEALRPQSELFARELPDWQPLIETWKAKGGKHASDVVASYKTLKPAPTSDFRKIRRYSKVLMQKLRRQILTPWTTDDYAVLSVAQGTYRILWLPNSTGRTGVLYTVGLGPCIGLAIEATSDTGAGANGSLVALAHADSDTAVAQALEEMTREIHALAPGKVVKMSLTLIGGRVSAQGKVRAQFASILDSMKNFQENSEMCTLLSPGAIAGGVAAGLVATKPLPSLTNSSSGAVACAEELVKNIKRDDSGAQVAAMGGKLKTGSLPTA